VFGRDAIGLAWGLPSALPIDSMPNRRGGDRRSGQVPERDASSPGALLLGMAIAAVAPLTAIALFFADSELWMRAALGVLPIMFGVDLMLTADAGGARCPRCRAKARALP
jgi:hypothetical protein